MSEPIVTSPTVEVANKADCYFYYYSSCNKGNSCPFRHEPTALRNETMCVYWLKGNCNKPQCIYRHMEITKKRDKIPCFFESQPGGCKKLHCPFLHNNIMDQLREEDVPKKPDIILPVKDSQNEYETDETTLKLLQTSISNQLKAHRSVIESEDSSPIELPALPASVREPIIVPLHDGESDNESCPSPEKAGKEENSDTDWELERLKEIQMEEGSILGYSFESPTNCRQTLFRSSSSSNDNTWENETYVSDEDNSIISEDIEDSVHRRLQSTSRTVSSSNFGMDTFNSLGARVIKNDYVESTRRVYESSSDDQVFRDSIRIVKGPPEFDYRKREVFMGDPYNNVIKDDIKKSVKDRLGFAGQIDTGNYGTSSVKERLNLDKIEIPTRKHDEIYSTKPRNIIDNDKKNVPNKESSNLAKASNVRDRLNISKRVNRPSGVNIMIKSLAEIIDEKEKTGSTMEKIKPTVRLVKQHNTVSGSNINSRTFSKESKNVMNRIQTEPKDIKSRIQPHNRESISLHSKECNKRLNPVKDMSSIKIKTLAEIKAEKGGNGLVSSAPKRPISPIRFDTKKIKPTINIHQSAYSDNNSSTSSRVNIGRTELVNKPIKSIVSTRIQNISNRLGDNNKERGHGGDQVRKKLSRDFSSTVNGGGRYSEKTSDLGHPVTNNVYNVNRTNILHSHSVSDESYLDEDELLSYEIYSEEELEEIDEDELLL